MWTCWTHKWRLESERHAWLGQALWHWSIFSSYIAQFLALSTTLWPGAHSPVHTHSTCPIWSLKRLFNTLTIVKPLAKEWRGQGSEAPPSDWWTSTASQTKGHSGMRSNMHWEKWHVHFVHLIKRNVKNVSHLPQVSGFLSIPASRLKCFAFSMWANRNETSSNKSFKLTFCRFLFPSNIIKLAAELSPTVPTDIYTMCLVCTRISCPQPLPVVHHWPDIVAIEVGAPSRLVMRILFVQLNFKDRFRSFSIFIS